MLCYVYSALPRSFAALSLSLAHTHSLTDCPRCCCRCFTFIYIVRRVAVALLLPLLRSRRSLLTFCYFITRSLTRSHEQRAAFSRLLLYSRFFTLLYVCITLHTLRYVSLRYVLLLLVKRFLSFFLFLFFLYFVFVRCFSFHVFILIPPRAFIALGRSFIFASTSRSLALFSLFRFRFHIFAIACL